MRFHRQKNFGSVQLVLIEFFYGELRNLSSQRNYGHSSFGLYIVHLRAQGISLRQKKAF
jgi:hypothetical protein